MPAKVPVIALTKKFTEELNWLAKLPIWEKENSILENIS